MENHPQIQNIVNAIRVSIKEAKIKIAIEKISLLESILEDKEIKKHLIINEFKFNNFKSKYIQGTVSDNEQNQIISILLDICDNIEENIKPKNIVKKSNNRSVKKNKNNFQNLRIHIGEVYRKEKEIDRYFNDISAQKFEIEGIKKIIKYDYLIEEQESVFPSINLQLGKLNLGITHLLSCNNHTILYQSKRPNPYVLKILQPDLYDKEKNTFIERHKKQKELANRGLKIAEINSYKIDKDEHKIALVITKKYKSNLRTYVLKNGTTTNYYEIIRKIFKEIILTIQSLHNLDSQKIAHRDIIPSNILLDDDNNPYLSDFDNIYIDSSKILNSDLRKSLEKRYFNLYMKPTYMAKLNDVLYDGNISFQQAKKLDLYSLCVTLLFCLVQTRFNTNLELIKFLQKKGNKEESKFYALDILSYPHLKQNLNPEIKFFFEKGLDEKKGGYATIEDLMDAYKKIEYNLSPVVSKPDSFSKKIKSKLVKSTMLVLLSGFLLLMNILLCSKTKLLKNKIIKQENKIDILDGEMRKETSGKGILIDSAHFKEVGLFIDSSKIFSKLIPLIGKGKQAKYLSPVEIGMYFEDSYQSSNRNGNFNYDMASYQNIDDAPLNHTKTFGELAKQLVTGETHALEKILAPYPILNSNYSISLIFVYYKDSTQKGFLRYYKTALYERALGYRPKSRPYYFEDIDDAEKLGFHFFKKKDTLNTDFISPIHEPYFPINTDSTSTVGRRLIKGDTIIYFCLDFTKKNN